MDETKHAPYGDEQLDRLVDGELTPAEYQQLMRALEQQPSGWRRCALAFLEAQAWSRELHAVRSEAEAGVGRAVSGSLAPGSWPVIPAGLPAISERRQAVTWLRLAAIAASFLVAFGLGLAVRLPGSRQATTATQPLADREPTVGPSPVAKAFSQVGPQPSPAVRQPAGRGENLRLVVKRGNGGDGESLELPVYDLTPENAGWLSERTPAVPAKLHRALQQAGAELRWERHVLPVQTPDGRRILVPLEQVEILPLEGQRYQ